MDKITRGHKQQQCIIVASLTILWEVVFLLLEAASHQPRAAQTALSAEEASREAERSKVEKECSCCCSWYWYYSSMYISTAVSRMSGHCPPSLDPSSGSMPVGCRMPVFGKSRTSISRAVADQRASRGMYSCPGSSPSTTCAAVVYYSRRNNTSMTPYASTHRQCTTVGRAVVAS